MVAVPDDRLDEAASQLAGGSRRHRLARLPPLRRAGRRCARAGRPRRGPHRGFPSAPGLSDPLPGHGRPARRDLRDRSRTGGPGQALPAGPRDRRRSVRARGRNRALYHAAAATAGNAPLALLDLALRAFEQAGVPRDVGLRGLVELAKGALDNAAALGPATALTGPVVRGDKAVIARHLAALEEFSPVDQRFYWALVRALIRTASHRPDGWKALEVAEAHDDLDREAAAGKDG